MLLFTKVFTFFVTLWSNVERKQASSFSFTFFKWVAVLFLVVVLSKEWLRSGKTAWCYLHVNTLVSIKFDKPGFIEAEVLIDVLLFHFTYFCCDFLAYEWLSASKLKFGLGLTTNISV